MRVQSLFILALLALCTIPSASDRLFAIGNQIFRDAKQPSLIDSYGGEYTSEQFRYIAGPIIPAVPKPGDTVKYSDTTYVKHNYFGKPTEHCTCLGHGTPCYCV